MHDCIVLLIFTLTYPLIRELDHEKIVRGMIIFKTVNRLLLLPDFFKGSAS